MFVVTHDLGSSIESIQGRHGNVHDDDVRFELLGKPNGFTTVNGLTHHHHLRFSFESKP